VPRARQALRKLLGDNTLRLEPENGGYRLSGETRLGPLFDGCEADGAGRAASMLRCQVDELVRAPRPIGTNSRPRSKVLRVS